MTAAGLACGQALFRSIDGFCTVTEMQQPPKATFGGAGHPVIPTGVWGADTPGKYPGVTPTLCWETLCVPKQSDFAAVGQPNVAAFGPHGRRAHGVQGDHTGVV